MLKRGQAITMDVLLGIIFFILVVVFIVGISFMLHQNKRSTAFPLELKYVFYNLDRNLDFIDQEYQFYRNYRIDMVKYAQFSNLLAADYADSVDSFIIGAVGESHGIGLDTSAYDTCLYLLDDEELTRIDINGGDALGATKNGVCDGDVDPCAGYDEAYALFRPVLLDYKDPEQNRIVQMNIILCAK